jgi:ABC-type transport system substrate-binding protein
MKSIAIEIIHESNQNPEKAKELAEKTGFSEYDETEGVDDNITRIYIFEDGSTLKIDAKFAYTEDNEIYNYKYTYDKGQKTITIENPKKLN